MLLKVIRWSKGYVDFSASGKFPERFIQGILTALYDSVIARDLPGYVDVDSSLLLFCGEIKKDYTVALSGEL